MLNKSGKSVHPCIVPDHREKTSSFSPLSMMLAVGLSYMAFIMLRYIFSDLYICLLVMMSILDIEFHYIQDILFCYFKILLLSKKEYEIS